MAEWQPIETAPKDGTPILGYGRYGWMDTLTDEQISADGGLGWIVMRWESASWRVGWLSITANPYADAVVPTHWMPLQEPPQ